MKTFAAWRLWVFLLIAVFMVGGPVYRHVLGGESQIFRNWIMFAGVGTGSIDARFHEIRPDGSEVRVDPRFVIGGPGAGRDDLPKGVWLVSEWNGGVRTVVGHLCRHYESGTRFRVQARLATRDGWQPLHRGDVFTCQEGT